MERPSRARNLMFYDGECGLCHRGVKFVLRHDAKGRFRFAPLQSELFAKMFSGEERRGFPDSVVVLDDAGRVLVLSDAAAYILSQLPGWGWAGGLLRVVPRPVRDLGYRAVAATRKRLFTRPAQQCPLVPPAWRGRFVERVEEL